MRSLSLAARGGFVTKALEDLREVRSSTPIWFGRTASGKSRVHHSEVAAIAWAMQQELVRRGFLDGDGRERSAAELVDAYARRRGPAVAPMVRQEVGPAASGAQVAVVGTCPVRDCQGDMVLQDGCAVCIDCGHSKCS